MSGKLLDTNAVIALQRSDLLLLELLKPGEEWLIPTIVMGELYYGAFNSDRAQDNKKVLRALSLDVTILSCDKDTSELYGEIRHILKMKGRPIPDNDIWIAALARQHSLPLVTRDSHFNEIAHLTLESW
jgi:tRNA(fMet)-specific endonuclease VapC